MFLRTIDQPPPGKVLFLDPRLPWLETSWQRALLFLAHRAHRLHLNRKEHMSLFQTFAQLLVHRDFWRSEDAVVAEHWRMDRATTCSASVQVVATGPSTTTNLDFVATTSSRTGRAIDIICASFSVFWDWCQKLFYRPCWFHRLPALRFKISRAPSSQFLWKLSARIQFLSHKCTWV